MQLQGKHSKNYPKNNYQGVLANYYSLKSSGCYEGEWGGVRGELNVFISILVIVNSVQLYIPTNLKTPTMDIDEHTSTLNTMSYMKTTKNTVECII